MVAAREEVYRARDGARAPLKDSKSFNGGEYEVVVQV